MVAAGLLFSLAIAGGATGASARAGLGGEATARAVTGRSPSPPPPKRASQVGVNVPNIGSENVPASYGRTIRADDGITLIRTDAPISATYGSGASPRWVYWDRVIRFAKLAGDSVLPVVWTSPAWQHPGCTAVPEYACPPDAAHYAVWAREVVALLGRAIAAGVRIDAIEFWNEPYCCGLWQPRSDPGAYVALLQVLAPTVWARFPGLKIAVSANYWQEGSTATSSGAEWFSQVLAADTTRLIDDPRILLATHNYSQSDPPSENRGVGWSFDSYGLARQQAIDHGKVDPHVLITEYGWEADTGLAYFGPVSESLQAQYAVAGAKMALATGYVDQVFIFEDRPGERWGYNMHRPDGTARPIARAIKTFISTGQ